jgi:hypothetical protein
MKMDTLHSSLTVCLCVRYKSTVIISRHSINRLPFVKKHWVFTARCKLNFTYYSAEFRNSGFLTVRPCSSHLPKVGSDLQKVPQRHQQSNPSLVIPSYSKTQISDS